MEPRAPSALEAVSLAHCASARVDSCTVAVTIATAPSVRETPISAARC
jgi:hypothetical protein